MRNRHFKRINCVVIREKSFLRAEIPFYLAYYHGVIEALTKRGYSATLEFAVLDAQTSGVLVKSPSFHTRSSDGIIGIQQAWCIPNSVDGALEKAGLPIVWLNRSDAPCGVHTIRVREEKAARSMMQALLQKSRPQDPVVWFGPAEEPGIPAHYSIRERFETIRNEAERADRDFLHFHSAKGANLMNDALPVFQGRKHQCVICYNEGYFHCVQQVAMLRGIKIPAQMQIGSFLSDLTYSPACPFVRIPEWEIGRRGAEYMLSVLQGKPDEALLHPIESVFDDSWVEG